jgi:5,10-methylenetetrahydromethanopterin reductase
MTPPRPLLGLNRWDVTTPATFAADVARAEALGWDKALLLCNPLMTWDPYVLLALAGQATGTIGLETFIDNPILRHPAVLADAIATVDAVAPGRARLVLGVGDTAVRFLGRHPATVATLEAAVLETRSLLSGGAVEVDAVRPARLHDPRPVPVWVAAGGPKTLRMAGRTAEGVYLRVGRNPENLRRAVDTVRAGAAEAGRHPDDVGIGLVLHTVTVQDPAAIAAISRSMAAGFYEYSPHLFDAAGIPWDGPPVDVLKQQVWPDFHHAPDLVESGTVVSFLPQEAADGFSLFGPPEKMAGQLREAIAVVGRVDTVVTHPVPTPGPGDDYQRWFIEDVWPFV